MTLLAVYTGFFHMTLLAVYTLKMLSSLVENQIDLELDFKIFFFVDSCWSGIVLDESN